MNLDLIHFLIENHVELCKVPVSGNIRDIFSLYLMSRDRVVDMDSDALVQVMTYNDFINELKDVEIIVPGSIIFKNENAPSPHEFDTITFIDVVPLKILYYMHFERKDKNSDSFDSRKSSELKTQPPLPTPISSPQPFDKFMDLLDMEKMDDMKTIRNNPLNKVLLTKLNNILETEPQSYQLGRERAKESTPITNYIPSCMNHEHSSILSSTVYIVNNKIISMQWSKLSKYEIENPEFVECLQNNIHYVPNLKPQTDLSLGDCSYLDTCHKLNSCRYLHYLQYIPESLLTKISNETKKKNDEIEQNGYKIPFYSHGNCSSVAVKEQLPPQWIKCDVRKFDFNIIGKFSVVIADPAWNIHMNLPYGTCNDIELLQLPLNHLQNDGVLFLWVTGRAIELGKESLMNWGYKVINEISWIKTNQLGRTIVTGRTGHWLNHSKEHLLVGIKGDPRWVNKHIDIDLVVSTTRETSRKPDELYGMIERLVGPHARKLEIFGRDHNIRPGWLTIGNQLTGTCIHEMDVKTKYDKFIANNNKNKENRYRLPNQQQKQNNNQNQSLNKIQRQPDFNRNNHKRFNMSSQPLLSQNNNGINIMTNRNQINIAGSIPYSIQERTETSTPIQNTYFASSTASSSS
ncbi:mRNA (N6-adenosine)-methyltransferase NDAI_0B02700 [Naumovozyma dairenensis CBS 421]|uniref:mRNA m(6)A methyltransferase n=1 Tax=Naumovozyma dairenensis (strain ATCC 10597 / BCRC 20456 / CBS 421 / NBRC 0211 / NRRL Y-12639) TaxID=1071378 RepID=G0W694_NAUDC|nr:hypothetical protein NDAI_0B02700 [Naumovozyma dairenensis CBS 421]CCD23305.1 hypothetical protein NDAI_0B02700 [Naumovozyma dairenensis CBS 421]